ncbi:MAG: type II secretion system protein M [Deltaproteobacteria bacterium]|nr:type II secretion system protein M [Deltaproteobacteria bacterium]
MLNSRFLSALNDKYHDLTRRERTAVTVACMGIAFFLLLQFLYFPLSEKIGFLESAVKTRENDLAELKKIVAQYRRHSKDPGDTEKTAAASFNLFSALEKFATKTGLMDKIDYMKPGTMMLDASREENWVEVKMNQIDLEDFTDYLFHLQTEGKGIYIKRLSMRKEGEFLNLILQPAIVKPK